MSAHLAADNACYAFQVTDYAKHFTCISLDPREARRDRQAERNLFDELFADDVAAFMGDRRRLTLSGLSLGGAIGLWLAGKYPERVKTLSLHSCWPKTDPFLKVIVQGWQTMAKGLGSVQEMIIQGILPFCLTPELYAAKPEYLEQLATPSCAAGQTSRSRPSSASRTPSSPMTLLLSSARSAPASSAFGSHDIVTSAEFVEPFQAASRTANSSSSRCARTLIYENVSEFNEKTLAFLKRHVG